MKTRQANWPSLHRTVNSPSTSIVFPRRPQHRQKIQWMNQTKPNLLRFRMKFFGFNETSTRSWGCQKFTASQHFCSRNCPNNSRTSSGRDKHLNCYWKCVTSRPAKDVDGQKRSPTTKDDTGSMTVYETELNTNSEYLSYNQQRQHCILIKITRYDYQYIYNYFIIKWTLWFNIVRILAFLEFVLIVQFLTKFKGDIWWFLLNLGK